MERGLSVAGLCLNSCCGSFASAPTGWDTCGGVLTLHPDGDYFYGVAFSPDGNTVGLLERNTHVLRLWRAPSWEQIAAAEGNGNQVGPR
jgi:hypothetical protein